jgi:hypothetical protein
MPTGLSWPRGRLTPQILTEGLVGAAPFVIASVSIGLLLAAVCGGLLVVGRPIPPIATASSAGVPTLVLALVAWSGSSLGTEEGLGRSIAAGLVAPIIVGIPALLLLTLCAAAGVKDPPRRWIGAAIGAVVVAAVGIVVVVQGQRLDDTLLTGVEAAFYVGTGLFVVAALVAGGTTGPEAAAAATVTWACLVASGETAARALAEFELLFNVGGRPVTDRRAIVAAFQTSVIDPTVPYAWAVVVLAMVACLVGVATSAPEPRRIGFSTLGLLWLGAAAALMGIAHLDETQLATYAASLPAPTATP